MGKLTSFRESDTILGMDKEPLTMHMEIERLRKALVELSEVIYQDSQKTRSGRILYWLLWYNPYVVIVRKFGKF